MLKRQAVPILEYDPCYEAVIDPAMLAERRPCAHPMPKGCVIAFLHKAMQTLIEREQPPCIYELPSVCGNISVYQVERGGIPLALMLCSVGAPVAAGVMEEMHALGVEQFISCGGVGVLNRELDVGTVLLPERALRDEGVSHHYLPPDRFVQANEAVLQSNIRVLEELGENYVRLSTWTTDAFYRETRDKVNLRRQEGCSCVEMECAAFMAVAQHRKINYGALLYAGDNLDGEKWDSRDWHHHRRRDWLLETSLLCAARLVQQQQQQTVGNTEE